MIVLWRITDRCNLACGFCAHDRRLQRERLDANPAQVLRFAQLLADWQQQSSNTVLLSWLGGEPLLWPPLLQLDRQISPLGLRLSQTSNGTRLHDPAIRAHLLEHYAELTLSIDAPGPLHDQLRGFHHGYTRLRHGIEQLIAERRRSGSPLKLRVNTVLMQQTIEHYPQLALELAQLGVDELSFNALGGRDRPEFYPSGRIQPTHWQTFMAGIPALRAQLQTHGTTLLGQSSYLQRIAASTHNQPMSVSSCAPGEQFLFIDARGRVAPCSQTVDKYGIDIDELVDVRDMSELPARFGLAQAQHRTSSCADCPSTQVWGKFGGGERLAAGERPAGRAKLQTRSESAT